MNGQEDAEEATVRASLNMVLTRVMHIHAYRDPAGIGNVSVGPFRTMLSIWLRLTFSSVWLAS